SPSGSSTPGAHAACRRSARRRAGPEPSARDRSPASRRRRAPGRPSPKVSCPWSPSVRPMLRRPVPVAQGRLRRARGGPITRASPNLARTTRKETAMKLDAVPVGPNPPWDINVVVEIPQGGLPVKYEMDKASGALFVDRFLHTAMYYPGNYGLVPHTLSADGAPCDVIVLNPTPVVPGCVIPSRPLAVLIVEREQGMDEKILAVPVDALH